MTRDYVTITYVIYRDDHGEPTCKGCEFNEGGECRLTSYVGPNDTPNSSCPLWIAKGAQE